MNTEAAASAQQAPISYPGIPDVSRVASGFYQVDPDHAQVLFTVNHLGFSHYTGQFIQPSGSLTIDPAQPNNAKVDVTFAIALVSTTSTHLNQVLQAADSFDASNFPRSPLHLDQGDSKRLRGHCRW
jgi:polyisoprenoid-binding protein YceI